MATMFESGSKGFSNKRAEKIKISHTRLSDTQANKIIQRIDFEKLNKKLSSKMLVNEIEALKSIARLVVELKERIPHYDTVLSDDASGRIVSLLLRNIIKRTRDENGKKPLQTYFIAGGVHNDWQTQEKLIDKFIASKKDNTGKVLWFFKEVCSSGRT